MKRLYFLFITVFFLTFSSSAQVDVTATGGVISQSYTTLKDAFDAINLGIHTGTITIGISGNTIEAATAVLNASGSGSASYTTISVSPTGGTTQIITGVIAGPLVDLNGADNVTINGLNTGGNALQIVNTSIGAASTVRFINDATGNTITNCSLQGATTSTATGTVFFSTGASTGNDNNTISNCDITGTGAAFPVNAVYSFGTSSAIDNSNITLNGNNISDFFSATTATTAVNANNGSSNWIITSNKFFQSATRTYTTGATHIVIELFAGAGYNVSGNTIGYASAAGTGIYTMAGTVATRLVAIYVAAATTGTVNSIQGNTITAISLATSSGAATVNGVLCGIYLLGASNDNVGNITPNVIGGSTGTGLLTATPTTTQGQVVGIASASTGIVNIQNNIIGGLTSAGATAAVAGAVAGINVAAAALSLNISGNTIGNSTTNNMRAGVSGTTTGNSIASGIFFSAVPSGVIVNNNTVQNFASFGTNTASYVRGIWSANGAGFSTVVNFTNNTITNLTTNSGLTTVASAQCSAAGMILGFGNNSVVSQNTITNISNTNTAATASFVEGIGISSGTNTTVSFNKIYNITNAGASVSVTAPSVAAGILIYSGTTLATVHNNMISLGNSQTTNTAFIGIAAFHAATPNPADRIYYNTVNIEGTAASGAQPSFAFYRGNFSATAVTVTVDIRDNIFNNNRSGGTGRHFAISNDYGATVSATGWAANASNSNVLNAVTATTVGNWGTDQTFTGWQTASSSDAASFTAVPVTFVNSATDLHLNMGVTPTVIESSAQVISGITTDIDGQSRPGPAGSVNGGGAAPDPGADEIDAVPLDQQAPVITYTPLTFTCAGDRTLSNVNITDATGVPVSGAFVPRIYYKNGIGGTYYSQPGTLTSGTGQNGFWSFNIVSADFGGVAPGNIIYYYIIAQDLVTPTPYISSNPSGVVTTGDVNSVVTPPASPNSYVISSSLSGTYTVGTSGIYPTVTAAVNAYSTSCLSGPVTFLLSDASYTEAGTMTINNPGGSAVNTLTIKPDAGVISTISAAAASGAVFKITSNYVTIDGSNNGSSSRNLTITNTSATSPNVILIGSTGTTPITNVIVKNSTVINGINTATAIFISDGASGGSSGYFNNITIQNNSIQKAFIGAYANAIQTVGNGSGLSYLNNDLNTAGANAISNVGLYAQGVDGITVQGNHIGNFDATGGQNDVGIWFASGTSHATASGNTVSGLGMTLTTAFGPIGINITSGTSGANNVIVTGNTVSGLSSAGTANTYGISLGFTTSDVNISGNTVTNIKNSNTGGYGALGISLNSLLPTANVLASNNFVSDVAGFGFTTANVGDNGYGIIVNNGGGYNIVNNTVLMNANQTLAGSLPAAFNVTATANYVGGINVVNNIFSNTQTAGSTERYAIYSSAPPSVFGTIDFNDYYTATGPDLGFIGSNRTNLAAVKAGFGGNQQSINIQPSFVGSPDLHLTVANCGLDNRGVPFAGVTTDIDGAPRDAGAPDMGADEFSATLGATLAVLSPGLDSTTHNASTGAPYYSNFTCAQIAQVLPAPGSPVSGLVKTKVTVDASVQSYLGKPYVQRHYDIEPAVSASTATATVTLYALQSEFDAFNIVAAAGSYPLLPTGPADAGGISNLHVTQYHGVGTAPGNYSGAGLVIDPADANIVWNATNSWWEITFPVAGFSGFYINTSLNVVPVSLLNFTAQRNGKVNQIKWSTSQEINSAYFMLEHSTDGVHFKNMTQVAAAGNSSTQRDYSYIDASPVAGINYYRLNMFDLDGRSKYSPIRSVKNEGAIDIAVYPNPVKDIMHIDINAERPGKGTMLITDMAGKIILSTAVTMIQGGNTLPVDMSKFAAGTYIIKVVIADAASVKQFNKL